jgi:hypothetical protein
VFCRIADGGHRDSKTILYEDDRLVCFPDISPSGAAHFQVVPKEHLLNVASLQAGEEHQELGIQPPLSPHIGRCSVISVQSPPKNLASRRRRCRAGAAKQMLQAGIDVCDRLHPGTRRKFGYHVPPFMSVQHLQ